jgi:hypothetical protein
MYIDGHNVRCKKEERENESFFLSKKENQIPMILPYTKPFLWYCGSYHGFDLQKIIL